MFQESLVELLDEEPFSADLVEPAVEDFISGRLHGQKFGIQLRMSLVQILNNEIALYHRESTLTASYY